MQDCPEIQDLPEKPLSQAGRILRKFGGAKRLSEILAAVGRKRDYVTVYRWDKPREKGGTGGFIPTRVWEDIFVAARYEGIVITAEDLDPRQPDMHHLLARAFPRTIRKKKGQVRS